LDFRERKEVKMRITAIDRWDVYACDRAKRETTRSCQGSQVGQSFVKKSSGEEEKE
jgi:hypothetical protein